MIELQLLLVCRPLRVSVRSENASSGSAALARILGSLPKRDIEFTCLIEYSSNNKPVQIAVNAAERITWAVAAGNSTVATDILHSEFYCLLQYLHAH